MVYEITYGGKHSSDFYKFNQKSYNSEELFMAASEAKEIMKEKIFSFSDSKLADDLMIVVDFPGQLQIVVDFKSKDIIAKFDSHDENSMICMYGEQNGISTQKQNDVLWHTLMYLFIAEAENVVNICTEFFKDAIFIDNKMKEYIDAFAEKHKIQEGE